MGEQINTFYEKFEKVQNDLVYLQDEYEMLKREQNFKRGNTVAVEDISKNMNFMSLIEGYNGQQN
jgi:hypothetical protein